MKIKMVLVQIDRSGPRGKDMKRRTLGVIGMIYPIISLTL